MNKIKILHCADLHLDTKMAHLEKNDLIEVFSNIIKFAKKQAVQIILIAGDVFDNLSVNKQTLRFLELTFSSIPEIKVFIAPGNHDPYNNKSFYNLVKWPENVHIFKGNIEKIYISELNTNVYGAAFTTNYMKESNLKMKAEEGKINLMVLHGELATANSINEYNPITLEDIENSNLDYLALGHRHCFSGIQNQGRTYYAYSGCPQGRGFDELGEKGVIFGEVYNHGVNLKFKTTCKRRYLEKNIDISNLNSYIEIKERILSKIPKEERKLNLYKIILQGEISDDFILKEDVITNNLQSEFYFIKIIDNTEIKYNYRELAKSNSIRGVFTEKILKKIDESQDEKEKDILKQALKIGLRALSQEEVNIGDF